MANRATQAEAAETIRGQIKSITPTPRPRRADEMSREKLEQFLRHGRQLRARVMRDAFTSLFGLLRPQDPT